MDAVVLHTAAIDNSGVRRDAGERVAVGNGPQEITHEFAKALIAASAAVESNVPAHRRSRAQPDATSDEAE